MVSGLDISETLEAFRQSAARASRRHLTLADVPVGGKAIIESLPDHTAFGRRLMEIGLLPGSEATVVGRAPLRDPIQIRVLGALIAIRKADAVAVHVSPIPDGD